MKLIDNNSPTYSRHSCSGACWAWIQQDNMIIIISLLTWISAVSGVQDAVVECCTVPSTRTHSHSCCSTVTQPSQQHWLLYWHKEAGLWRWSNQNFNQGLISVSDWLDGGCQCGVNIILSTLNTDLSQLLLNHCCQCQCLSYFQFLLLPTTGQIDQDRIIYVKFWYVDYQLKKCFTSLWWLFDILTYH